MLSVSIEDAQVLDFANVYLNNTFQVTDPTMPWCHDIEVSPAHAKKAAKHIEHDDVRTRIATAYTARERRQSIFQGWIH